MYYKVTLLKRALLSETTFTAYMNRCQMSVLISDRFTVSTQLAAQLLLSV